MIYPYFIQNNHTTTPSILDVNIECLLKDLADFHRARSRVSKRFNEMRKTDTDAKRRKENIFNVNWQCLNRKLDYFGRKKHYHIVAKSFFDIAALGNVISAKSLFVRQN